MVNGLSSFKNILKFLFATVLVIGLFTSTVQAQCGLSSFQTGASLTPSSTFNTVSAGSGTYVDFNVTAGNIYSFYYTTCTDPLSGDAWDMTISSTSATITYNNSTSPVPNTWTGGINCPSCTRPTSAEWYATYTGTVRVNVKSYAGGNCLDYVSNGGSAVIEYKVCSPSGDLGYGTNNWNVDAFATGDISIPNSNARYGTYTDNISDLDFNTTNYWADTSKPSSAAGWNGCLMPNENFTIRARRKGFPCNLYKIQGISGNEQVSVYLNGTQIFTSATFSTVTTVGNAGGYVLGANDSVEIRMTGLCGANSVHIQFVPQGLPAVSGGTIGGVTDGSSVCQGNVIGNFTNVTAGSGGASGFLNGGAITYDWKLSTDGGNTFNSVGVTTATWNSTTTVPPGATYVITREATDQCGNVAYSNAITVYGRSTPNGSLSPSAQTICTNGSATLTLNLTPSASGPFNVVYTDGVNNYTANSINDGSTVQVSPLANTTYVFSSIVDQYGCTRTSNFNGGALVLIATPIDVSNVATSSALCNGSSTGSLTVTASGGVGPLSFSDDAGSNFQSGNVFTSLPSGSYTIVVKDSFGCSKSYGNNPVNIGQPNALSLSLTETDASCANVFDGSITATSSGGVTPYTYTLNGGPSQPGNVFSGLQAGNYLVRLYDNNGCLDTASISVNNTYIISVDTVSTNSVSCYGAADGSLTVKVNGGVPPYQYSINGVTFQSSGTFSGLTGGTYIVIGRDSKGCTESVNVVITQPGQINAVVDSIINVQCAGTPTGAIYIHPTGGTPGYTYNWTGGQNSQNLTGVNGGSYNVTVTDSRGCSAVGGATVTQPYALSLNIATYQYPLCNGDSNGSIDMDANGGVPPYTFAWSNGATSQSLSNIPGGTYTATVTDANGCQQVISQTLVNPALLSINTTSTNVTCHGASDGTANVTVNGGNSPYTYLWSNYQVTQGVSGLSGGLYNVVVTDQNGCHQSDTVRVNEPTAIAISLTITNVSCFGANDGSVNATVTGGISPYSYSWSTGATTQNISGLAGGTSYVLTVTDANNCSATAVAFVVNPPAIVTGVVVKNVSCFGDSNGVVNLIISGGTPGYTYLWSNGATTQNISNLQAQSYIVTVTDIKGCTHVDSGTVNTPGPLFTSGIIKNVSCNGNCDGSVFTTPYGGTVPYTYQWNSGQSTANIIQLCGGNYYLTLTDANGCKAASLYIVRNPPVLGLSISTADNSCFGSCNGALQAVPTGGTTPYSYLWNTFDTTATITNACAGHYHVLVTDSNGCQLTDTANVLQPAQIQIVGNVTNVLCHGFNTGSISVNVAGGVAPFSFKWSNGDSTSVITNLVAGTYGLSVTDSHGCVNTAVFTVTESPGMNTNASVSNPTCYGSSNGFISVVVTGGAIPYTYAWNTTPAQVGATATGLKAGSYALTITDANNCSASVAATLTTADPIKLNTSASGAKCYNTATGSVSVVVTGGTAPYMYQLDGVNKDTSVFYNLLPGEYYMVVRDANGCEGADSFNVRAGETVGVTLTAPDAVILTGMSTQLIADAHSSDTAQILHYYWSPVTIDSVDVFDYSACGDSSNCSNPSVKPPFTTTFKVTVMNSDSCFASDTVVVYVKNEQNSFIPTAFTPNNDGLNDRFQFDILGATTIEISIFDRWGERVYYNANQANGIGGSTGWDGTKGGKAVPDDTYTYQMKVTFFDGTVKNKTGTVNVMR